MSGVLGVMKRAPLSAPSLSIAPDKFIGLFRHHAYGAAPDPISAVTIVWPKWRRSSNRAGIRDGLMIWRIVNPQPVLE